MSLRYVYRNIKKYNFSGTTCNDRFEEELLTPAQKQI